MQELLVSGLELGVRPTEVQHLRSDIAQVRVWLANVEKMQRDLRLRERGGERGGEQAFGVSGEQGCGASNGDSNGIHSNDAGTGTASTSGTSGTYSLQSLQTLIRNASKLPMRVREVPLQVQRLEEMLKSIRLW